MICSLHPTPPSHDEIMRLLHKAATTQRGELIRKTPEEDNRNHNNNNNHHHSSLLRHAGQHTSSSDSLRGVVVSVSSCSCDSSLPLVVNTSHTNHGVHVVVDRQQAQQDQEQEHHVVRMDHPDDDNNNVADDDNDAEAESTSVALVLPAPDAVLPASPQELPTTRAVVVAKTILTNYNNAKAPYGIPDDANVVTRSKPATKRRVRFCFPSEVTHEKAVTPFGNHRIQNPRVGSTQPSSSPTHDIMKDVPCPARALSGGGAGRLRQSPCSLSTRQTNHKNMSTNSCSSMDLLTAITTTTTTTTAMSMDANDDNAVMWRMDFDDDDEHQDRRFHATAHFDYDYDDENSDDESIFLDTLMFPPLQLPNNNGAVQPSSEGDEESEEYCYFSNLDSSCFPGGAAAHIGAATASSSYGMIGSKNNINSSRWDSSFSFVFDGR